MANAITRKQYVQTANGKQLVHPETQVAAIVDMPTIPAVGILPPANIKTAAPGVSNAYAREDHSHALSFSSTLPSGLGAAAGGSSIYPAHADHVHPLPLLTALPSGVGTAGDVYTKTTTGAEWAVPVVDFGPGGQTRTIQYPPIDVIELPVEVLGVSSVAYSAEQNLWVISASTSEDSKLGKIFTSPDGVTWTARELPSAIKAVQKVVYSATQKLWVAAAGSSVGSNTSAANRIFTSSDGITWVARTLPISVVYVSALAHSEEQGIWIAGCSLTVEGTERLLKSTDGITWTVINLPVVVIGIRTVYYSPSQNLWVAGALAGDFETGGKLFVSTDTDTWTLRTLPVGIINVIYVAHGEEQNLWVMSAQNILNQYKYFTSEDAITWVGRTLPVEVDFVRTVRYSSKVGKWFLTCTTTDPSYYKVYASTNGISGWEGVPLDAEVSRINDLVYSAEQDLWIACASGDTEAVHNHIFTSSSGLDWPPYPKKGTSSYPAPLDHTHDLSISHNTTSELIQIADPDVVMPKGDYYFNKLVYSEEQDLWITIPYTIAGTKLLASKDGVRWNKRQFASDGLYSVSDIAYSAEQGLWVVVCQGTSESVDNRIFTSPDAVTWTMRKTPVPVYGLTCVAYSSELNQWVVGVRRNTSTSSTANKLLTSTDGITWSMKSFTVETGYVFSLAWSAKQNLWLAGGYTGNSSTSGKLYTSPDGNSWTMRTFPVSTNFVEAIAYSEEQDLWLISVAGSESIGVFKSSDAITWTQVTLPNSNGYMNTIVYNEELHLWVMGAKRSTNGVIDRIFTSPDAINWTSVTLPSVTDSITTIAYSSKRKLWAAGGRINSSKGTFYLSRNAVDWYGGLVNAVDKSDLSGSTKTFARGDHSHEIYELGDLKRLADSIASLTLVDSLNKLEALFNALEARISALE